MDFNYRKPSHVFALFAFFIAMFLLVIYPLIQFFLTILGIIPPLTYPDTSTYSAYYRLLIEIVAVFVQVIIVFMVILLGVPIFWYSLVNNFSTKEIFVKLQLHLSGIRNAFLWGIVGVIFAFAITLIINFGLQILGVDIQNLSNIQDLEQMFSVPSLYVMVAMQPIAEEIFFRGFLLDKVSIARGQTVAIILTSVLFGLSHMSYLRDYWVAVYTAGMATIMGLIFAFVVVKTKNLYAAIFAHTAMNVISLTIYFLDKSLGI